MLSSSHAADEKTQAQGRQVGIRAIDLPFASDSSQFQNCLFPFLAVWALMRTINLSKPQEILNSIFLIDLFSFPKIYPFGTLVWADV